MCGLLSTWPLKAAVILIKNRTGTMVLGGHSGGIWVMTGDSSSTVRARSIPGPTQQTVKGRGKGQASRNPRSRLC